MLRCATIVVLVFLMQGGAFLPASAQGFNERYDPITAGQAQFGWCIEQNANGEYVVIGNLPWFDSLFYASSVASLAIDPLGEELVGYRTDVPLKASYPGWCNSSIVLPDGRLHVAGSTADGQDTNRVALYWFDNMGQPISHVEILPIARSWIAYQHKNTPDGGFIITGVTSATGFQDIFLLKTDSLGNVQWWRTYGHPNRLDYAGSVDLAPDGGYYIGGTYTALLPDKLSRWVLRTDSDGTLLWDTIVGDPWYDTFSAHVTTTADGNVVIASGDYSGVIQNHWPQLIKFDSLGNVLWDKRYGFDQFGTGFFVAQEVTPFGDLIACGQRFFSNGMGGGYSKGTLLRTTANGDSLWMYDYAYYDSTVTDCEGTLRDVQPTPDGGFVAVGTAYGAINGNNPPGLSQDVWVVKVDSLGCIEPGCNVPMGVTTQITNLGNALSIAPNPASERVQLIWQLPAALRSKGAAELSIVSAQGMLVRTVPCDLSRGSMELDVQDLAPGVYHLHMVQQGTWVSGGKLVVE